MKIKIILFFLVLPMCYSYAQENITEQFAQAKEYNLSGNKEKSEETYEMIIEQNKDNSVVKLLAQYYLAEVILRDYYREESKYKIDYPRAKAYHEEIYKMRTFLSEKVNRKELSKFTTVSYLQILHNTCEVLAIINMKLDDYREALTYAYLSKNEYPSQISMNVDNYYNDYYQDSFIFKCYVGLQQPDSAVVIMLPYITKGSITASEAQDRLLELVEENQQIKEELRKSLNTTKVLISESNPDYLNVLITYKDFIVLIDSVKLTEDGATNINDLKKIYSSKLKATFLYESLTEDIQIPSESYISILDYQDFKGKYTLLDFWASWCAPCREENPTLIQAYQQFKDKGFEILSVSIDTNESKWQKAIKEDEIGEWKHLIDTTGWKSKILEEYSIQSIPANFLISPKGKIIEMNLRGEALLKKLEELLGE